MLGKRANKQQLLLQMRGKSEEDERHDCKECGCFASYEERAALHKQGLLWLQERGLSDRGLAVLNERDGELNRIWCEGSLEEFRDYWRNVVREAA